MQAKDEGWCTARDIVAFNEHINVDSDKSAMEFTCGHFIIQMPKI